jgi:hypothetical protein
MTVELDHFFLWVSAGAGPEADRLLALGLTEGKPNRHPGQGTACRRFFFANAYLELLWVENAEEAQGEVARPQRLFERWSGRTEGACPFGVLFRPAGPGVFAPPFATWEFRPPYLPAPLLLHVGTSADCIEEPLLSCFPVPRQPGSSLTREAQPLDHRTGFREVTALRIFTPYLATRSPVMQAVEQTGAVSFHQGPEYVAEIGFDDERQERGADLRPVLPLILRW